MTDIDGPWEAGGAIILLLFAGIIWYPSLMAHAGDPTASGQILSHGFTLMLFSVLPTSTFAVGVDIIVAVASSILAGSIGLRGKAILFVGGAGWVLTNMVMTALNPPY